jgi:hypothetical protein
MGSVLTLAAQTNPLDLVPRLDSETRQMIEETIPHPTGNPLDIVPPPSSIAEQKPFLIVEPREEEIGLPNRYRRFVFSVTLFSLILLTFIFSLLRGILLRVYRGILNENILNQIFRDKESIGPFPYWTLYLLFFINGGFFLFLLSHQFNQMPWISDPYYLQLLKCIGVVTGLLLLKHLVLSIIAYVFPVEKEMRLYNFMILAFNIILGIALVPINLMAAYSPEKATHTIIIVLFYLFRHLRGVMIANNYLVFHKFHFLLYICTVEIAPVMVLLKLITG